MKLSLCPSLIGRLLIGILIVFPFLGCGSSLEKANGYDSLYVIDSLVIDLSDSLISSDVKYELLNDSLLMVAQHSFTAIEIYNIKTQETTSRLEPQINYQKVYEHFIDDEPKKVAYAIQSYPQVIKYNTGLYELLQLHVKDNNSYILFNIKYLELHHIDEKGDTTAMINAYPFLFWTSTDLKQQALYKVDLSQLEGFYLNRTYPFHQVDDSTFILNIKKSSKQVKEDKNKAIADWSYLAYFKLDKAAQTLKYDHKYTLHLPDYNLQKKYYYQFANNQFVQSGNALYNFFALSPTLYDLNQKRIFQLPDATHLRNRLPKSAAEIDDYYIAYYCYDLNITSANQVECIIRKDSTIWLESYALEPAIKLMSKRPIKTNQMEIKAGPKEYRFTANNIYALWKNDNKLHIYRFTR